jgi:REP element-mobilizing transposase RayT
VPSLFNCNWKHKIDVDMSNLFLNKFRVKSNRLKGHDYSGPAVYFVTILTDARILFLGQIFHDKMHLSPIGKIVKTNWMRLAKHFACISLDEFVIMPDHLHGILIINSKINYNNDITKNNEKSLLASTLELYNKKKCKDSISHVPSDRCSGKVEISQVKNILFQGQETKGGITKNHNPMISKDSLSYYLRWFKGKSTYDIRKAYPKIRFSWHPGFYDKIIKDKNSYYAAKKYIQNNPMKWGKNQHK